MILSFKKKEKIVYKLQENFKTALSTVVASIHGVTANAVNQLRKEARSQGIYIKVIPNSLLRKSVLKTPCSCLSDLFIGQSIVAFSTQKPNDAARIFIKFSKNHENFKIKGAAFEGKLIHVSQIDLLSNLPNYKESVLQLILLLQVIGIGNFISILKILSSRKVKL